MGASVCRHNLPKRKWQETYAPRCRSSTAQAPGSEESNLFQEIREEPALVNQKYPCFWLYSKLVSIPRSPQLVRLSSHVERPLMTSSLSNSASCLPQLPLDWGDWTCKVLDLDERSKPLKLAPKIDLLFECWKKLSCKVSCKKPAVFILGGYLSTDWISSIFIVLSIFLFPHGLVSVVYISLVTYPFYWSSIFLA